jgi:hypothetical protein
MLVKATVFPTNRLSVPSVAELPICQNTLQSTPPLITAMVDDVEVVSADPI